MKLRKLLQHIIMLSFLLTVVVFALKVSSSKPRLFILHSYQTDYSWTASVNIGIERAMLNHDLNHDVRFHYMDTKKKYNTEEKQQAAKEAIRAINDYNPDVIIAFDDDAQKYVAKHYIDKEGIQIVYAAVNATAQTYEYDTAINVTGILETKPIGSINEMWKVLLQEQTAESSGKQLVQKPRTLFLSDPSSSANHDAAHMHEFEHWGDIQYVKHQVAQDYKHWQEIILSAHKEYDLLLVGGYRKLKGDDGQFVGAKEVGQWTEKNSIATLIGINEFNSEDGIMFSIGASPYEQGEVAYTRAMQLLEDPQNIKTMQHTYAKQYIVALRKDAFDTRNLKIPKILEAFARATNHYYEIEQYAETK
ncbi:MAG: hypothetical protein HRU38_05230 [Saccharospirillaceae bacterium]|nr:hypothetical protein [Pseudomonadales bacterium]NRB78060.1 hypothetical protein [Saccharospirillaceae bacterium]